MCRKASLPQVPNHLKGNAVVQLSHAPLGQGAGSGGQSNPQENGAQSLKNPPAPGPENAVTPRPTKMGT